MHLKQHEDCTQQVARGKLASRRMYLYAPLYMLQSDLTKPPCIIHHPNQANSKQGTQRVEQLSHYWFAFFELLMSHHMALATEME